MMNFEEAIENLKNLIDNPEELTIAKLEEFLNNVSVTDNVCQEGATTHLYTKVSDYSFIDDSVRVIDHTDAARVLTYMAEGDDTRLYDNALKIALKNEYPNASLTDLEKKYMIEYLYGTETNGTGI